MKIVCDNCATKYSIADEKVSGKMFKIRCKKCSHIIVVKGTGEGDVAAQPTTGTDSNGQEKPQAVASAAEQQIWHLVIDREQVGPMTAEEVHGKFRGGQIDADTYAWKEGFDDWVKLGTIDDFRDLVGPRPPADDQATRRSSSADLYQQAAPPESAGPGADLFAAAAEPVRSSAPTASTMMAESASYGGPSLHSSHDADAPISSSSAPGPGVDIKSMTGARSENSVLFSLNNLQALATGGGGGGGAPTASSAGPAAKPGYANSQTEGSGLIDIRAMAAQTLSANSFSLGTSSKPDELPMVNDAPLFSPVAPSVLLPTVESPGMPKWVWALIGVCGVLVVGVGIVLVTALKQPPPAPAPTPPAAGQTPSGPSGGPVAIAPQHPAGTAPEKGAGTSPASPEPGAKAPAPKEPAAADSTDRGKPHRPRGDKGAKAARGDRGERDNAPPAQPARAETPPAPEVKKPPRPSRPKDDLDALLDSAVPGSGGRPKGEGAKKDLPEQLSMDVIKSGLKSVNGSVQACKTPGTYMVKLTIGRSGRVSDASVPGKAGDAAADCVARAVKGARFPEFSGDAQSLNYPFIIR